MKWHYNIFLLCFMAIGCQTLPDETGEFIRLEKELANIAHTEDKVTYINPYAQYGGENRERMAPLTDSLLLIADTYNRLITQTRQTDYSSALQIIRQQVERRKSKYIQRLWTNRGLDSTFVMDSELDIEFRKHALRPRLSRLFEVLYTATCGGNGIYSIMELHRYLTYQRQGDTIQGEYGLGYIVTDDLTAQLQLTHNGQIITPKNYSADSRKTEATFIPQDTGTHTLTGYITMDDPITGKQHTKQEQRTIYVKP